MSDLISRQAAIDIIDNAIDVFTGKFGAVYLTAIRENIEQLPPALGTNLAEVGTDCISRQAAINAIDECYCGGEDTCGEPWIYKENAVEAINMIEPILSVEPKRETATVSVGKSKGGLTMWYECAACGEPVNQGDTFCSGCGRELIHE